MNGRRAQSKTRSMRGTPRRKMDDKLRPRDAVPNPLSAAPGTAEYSAEYSSQHLTADLAADGTRSLFRHRLHHALPVLRTPDQLLQRAAGSGLLFWLFLRRRLCDRRVRQNRTLAQDFVGRFPVDAGVV